MPRPGVRPVPELLLVRHGRSAHVQTGWLDAAGLRRWMEAYDAAEITRESPPPAPLVALTADAARVVASDLPRAIASAALLAPGRDVVRTPLLREAPLETPDWPLPRLGGTRIPLGAWALVFGARWLATWARGAPPPGVDARALARAEEAADWLVAQAVDARGRVVAVTHATFRVLVTRALARRGWRAPDRRPIREWSAWRFAPAEAPDAADRDRVSRPALGTRPRAR